MPKGFINHYSVYRRKTDMPVVIHGTVWECLKVMGVSQATFYCYVSHTKYGTRKCKYEIFIDERDE